MNDITKAVVPIQGLATRFLPLSKAVPKELLPVGVRPMLLHALQELKTAGATDIILVVGNNRRQVEEYLKRSPQLEKTLEERNQEESLKEVQEMYESLEGLSFTFLSVAKAQGDGYAVLQAKKLVGDNPCFVLYPDDLVDASVSASAQLARVFKTSQKPVTALAKLPKERLSSYGVAVAEKIASRLYKIKRVVEKPQGEAPSDLAIVGRRIITPEVFEYIKSTKPNKKGEVILTEALANMVKDGKIMYGYEVEGQWWEAGNKEEWLKTHMHYTLQDPKLGKVMRQFIKEERF